MYVRTATATGVRSAESSQREETVVKTTTTSKWAISRILNHSFYLYLSTSVWSVHSTPCKCTHTHTHSHSHRFWLENFPEDFRSLSPLPHAVGQLQEEMMANGDIPLADFMSLDALYVVCGQ